MALRNKAIPAPIRLSTIIVSIVSLKRKTDTSRRDLSRSIKQRVFPSELSRHLSREDNWSGDGDEDDDVDKQGISRLRLQGVRIARRNRRILYPGRYPSRRFRQAPGHYHGLNSRLIALARSRDVRNSC